MMTSSDEQFVPKSDYDDLLLKLAEFKDTADKILEENRQLKEALTKIDAGIHKASEMVEGLAWTEDNKMITDLAFELAKLHPKKITMKYKGEMLIEIRSEK